MEPDNGKKQETVEFRLTPVGVVKWVLMVITMLFLAYMLFKFLVPKVAYS